MTHAEKKIGLLTLLAKGLSLVDVERTSKSLGDRRSYIGMSDIASGYECLRKCVLSKAFHGKDASMKNIETLGLKGDVERIQHVLKQSITMQRGHWQEPGLQVAFEATKQKLIPQLEINATVRGGVPVKAHLDFVLVYGGKNPAIRVIESKSYGRLPKEIYPSYEVQLYGQISLLEALWNKPNFSVKDAHGVQLIANVTFPELAKKLLGVTLPEDVNDVDIEGWVLGLSMSEAVTFGPYEPNQAALKACFDIAESVWNTMQGFMAGTIQSEDILYHKGLYPLCDYCDHVETCPKFTFVEKPEYESELLRLNALKASQKALEEEINEIESALKATYSQQVNMQQGDWIQAGEFAFRHTKVLGRKTLDTSLLRKLLLTLNVFKSDADVDLLLEKATKVGSPSSRFYLKRQKNAVVQTA